jgi:hypothetical protein
LRIFLSFFAKLLPRSLALGLEVVDFRVLAVCGEQLPMGAPLFYFTVYQQDNFIAVYYGGKTVSHGN